MIAPAHTNATKRGALRAMRDATVFFAGALIGSALAFGFTSNIDLFDGAVDIFSHHINGGGVMIPLGIGGLAVAKRAVQPQALDALPVSKEALWRVWSWKLGVATAPSPPYTAHFTTHSTGIRVTLRASQRALP